MIGFILDKKGKYFGFDISQNMLHKAKTRHEFKILFYLSAGEVEYLPFQSASFDLLLCLGLLAADFLIKAQRVISRERIDFNQFL
jgi:ubiquinone/menaquinone biosynthesis C-methylase UbiE